MYRSNLGFAALFAVAAGCSFNEGGVTFGDGGPGGPDSGQEDGTVVPDGQGTPDARVDALSTPDAFVADAPCPGDLLPFTPSNVGRCGMADPAGDLVIGVGDWELDTDSGQLYNNTTLLTPPSMVVSQNGGPDVRVVSVDSWTQSGDVYVVGSLPLVIISFGNVTLDGYLVAWSDYASPGPGGGIDAYCGGATGVAGSTQLAFNSMTGGSGGGGGGYGGPGGGGAKVNAADGPVIAAAGGTATGNTSLVPLRGGCNGGPGGNGGGPGGGGGGAIQVYAAGTLSMTFQSAVSARGGGGSPPLPFDLQPAAGGGGGGGSGGAVLLEATTLVLAVGAAVTTQGGGGGEGTRSGGDETLGGGDRGENARSLTAVAAQGGADENCSGGDGGDGGIRGTPPQNGFEGSTGDGVAAGGGGGGGGVGRIHFRATTMAIDPGAVISPAAQ